MDADRLACSELEDYQWLTDPEAADLAAAFADTAEPVHTVIAQLRKRLPASRAQRLADLLELRRRGGEKFTHADRMFFTRIGLEQATDEEVARYKSARFAAHRHRSPGQKGASLPWGDYCCGIGGDLLALAERGPVVGIDRDPRMAHLAERNATALLAESQRRNVTILCEEVANVDAADFLAWHLDPDRRPRGKRTTAIEWSSPDLETIERMLARRANAAIKLAPGATLPPGWNERCELEWISRRRECRQLVAWHGELADEPGRHRATILKGSETRTITGEPNQAAPIAASIERFVFDVDRAVSAARLTGTLAAEHALGALAHGPTYLTGPAPILDPALAAFEVIDLLPLSIKHLGAYFRERGIGRLEIKKRGNDLHVDPESLRKSLKLRGDGEAVLLVTRSGGRQIAIAARRVTHSPGER